MIVVLEEYKATLQQLRPQIQQLREALGMDRVLEPVSYTNLTLPTIFRV